MNANAESAQGSSPEPSAATTCQRSRLESASNIIDNARFFIEETESPDLLQQAKNACMGWELFAEELAAQLLAAGHEWPTVAQALKLDQNDRWSVECAERRADKLRGRHA